MRRPPMKLTEAKLKQIILEAIKNKNFQDFGISTPDEKLQAELGDEMFDKIQSLDPEQVDVMKQSFDPDYPRSIKQESLDAILVTAGFKPYKPKYNLPVLRKRNNVRKWFKGKPLAVGSIEFYTEYNIVGGRWLMYTVRIKTKKKKWNIQSKTIARGKIEIPRLFKLSLETEQDLRAADALMLSREKETIEKALEQYK